MLEKDTLKDTLSTLKGIDVDFTKHQNFLLTKDGELLEITDAECNRLITEGYKTVDLTSPSKFFAGYNTVYIEYMKDKTNFFK